MNTFVARQLSSLPYRTFLARETISLLKIIKRNSWREEKNPQNLIILLFERTNEAHGNKKKLRMMMKTMSGEEKVKNFEEKSCRKLRLLPRASHGQKKYFAAKWVFILYAPHFSAITQCSRQKHIFKASSLMTCFSHLFILEVYDDLMAARNETMTNLGETRLILKILLDFWTKETLSKDAFLILTTEREATEKEKQLNTNRINKK